MQIAYTRRKTEQNAKDNRKILDFFLGKMQSFFYLLITTNFVPTYFPAKEIAMIPVPGFFLKGGFEEQDLRFVGHLRCFFLEAFFCLLTGLCVFEGRNFSTNGLELKSIFKCIFNIFWTECIFLLLKHFRASPAFYF